MYIAEYKLFMRGFSLMFAILFLCNQGKLYADSLPDSNDTEPPVITSNAVDMSISCDVDYVIAFTSWYENAGGAIATDNSDTLNFIGIPELSIALDLFENSVSGDCIDRMLEVSFFAQDTCGNSSVDTTMASFIYADDEAPVVTQLAQPKVVYCNEGVRDSLFTWLSEQGGAAFSDNCDDDLDFQIIWTDSNGNSSTSQVNEIPIIPIDRAKCNWSVNVLFSSIDDCDNPQGSSASFTVIDTLAPVFSYLPQDTTVRCDAIPPNDVIATDICDGELEIEFFEFSSQSDNEMACRFSEYTIQREWIVADACSNQSIHTQTITVIDTVAPIFTVPTDREVSCENIMNIIITGEPIDVNETCGITIETFSDSLIGDTCPFQIERTWVVSDVCGNSNTAVQNLTIIDMSGPVISIEAVSRSVKCDSILDISSDFIDWINSLGGSSASEACSPLSSFAAVPGTYNINDTLSFPGTPVASMNDIACPSMIDGVLRSTEVDFVYYDRCGNASVTTASYIVADDIAPIISNCPIDISIDANPGSCNAFHPLTIPDAEDLCSNENGDIVRSLSQQIISSIPGDDNAIVDSLFFSFGPINVLNTAVVTDISLLIDLTNVDVDDADEYFYIKDEQGVILDSTLTTSLQCDDISLNISSISEAQFLSYTADGFIDFWLVPKQDVALPVLGINDACGISTARVELSYTIAQENGITWQVQVDDETPIDAIAGNSILLSDGMHVITYIVSDCAQNTATCSQNILVVDGESPIISCPSDISIYAEDTCFVNVLLSEEVVYQDNCSANVEFNLDAPDSFEESLLNFNLDVSTGQFLAANKQLSFEGLDSIRFNNIPPILTVNVSADINDDGEFFEIFAEDGSLIGSTPIGASEECLTTIQSQYFISIDTYNSSMEDGKLDLTFVANNNINVEGGGINSCFAIPSGSNTDGQSALSANLSFSEAIINYGVSGATEYQNDVLDSTELRLNVGTNLVTYYAEDASGNRDSCQYQIEVIDTIAPKLVCQNAVIFIHPSGLIDYVLQSSELILEVSDNCGDVDIQLEPSTFQCSDVSQSYEVTLTATDMSGNSTQCISDVRVEMPILNPTFAAGACEGDTLLLFADLPEAPIANAYTYSWSGPNGFVSSLQDPFILNPDASYSGTYTLEVEGFGACMSMGTVEVAVDQLVTPEIESDTPVACIGDEVLLTANSFSGNIEYQWYQGEFPNGVLMETTQNASYIVSPAEGSHFYYVIIEGEGCITNASPNFEIEIVAPPVATIINPIINICEGESIALGTDNFNPNYQYFWSGPDNFMSNGQFADVIENADISNQGFYNLIIQQGNCFSDTATAFVALFEKPDRPQITGDEFYCEGSSIVLSVNNVANADLYSWYLDDVLFTVTDNNSILINGVQNNLSGDWTVSVQESGCISDTSDIQSIQIEGQLDISANNDGPGCVGDSVQLNVPFIPDATYEWIDPQGDTIRMRDPKVPALEGEYTLTMTTANGCTTETSTFVEVLPVPVVTALSNSALACTDGMDTISFFPTIIPEGNYTYLWEGPLALENIENPELINVGLDANGTYSLSVFNGACASQTIETIVSYTATPLQPLVASLDTSLCEGTDLLIAQQNSYPIGYEYFWETPNGIVQTSEGGLNLVDVDALAEGYYVLNVHNGSCISMTSDSVFIQVNQVPDAPSILAPQVICEGEDLILQASNTTADSYLWTGPNGILQDQSMIVIPNVTENTQGVYTLQLIANGCQSEVSEELMIEVIQTPLQPTLESANYQICKSDDDQVQLCITNESLLPSAQYDLYINGQFIISSFNGCFLLNSTDDFIVAGQLMVEIQTRLGDCSSEPSESAMLVVSEALAIGAEIDDVDLDFCEEENVFLDIIAPSSDQITWVWTSDDDNVEFLNPSSSTTAILGLEVGNNEIYLTSSIGACSDYFIDTVDVQIFETATPVDDYFLLDFNQNSFLDILENDLASSGFILSIVQQPSSGSVSLINNLVQYEADPTFAGSQTFAYELCDLRCTDDCQIAFVTIEIAQSFDCIAPSIITPNDDGINDNFVVPCFNSGQFEDNEVKIFNEYGDEVYGAKPYRNDWNGTYQGSPLPVGTYYYVVDVGDGRKPLNGFLMIQR